MKLYLEEPGSEALTPIVYRAELIEYIVRALGRYVKDFDVPGVANELQELGPLVHPDTFWAVAERHDKTRGEDSRE